MDVWGRAIDLLTLVGVGATAWATWHSWRAQQRRDAAGKPTVSVTGPTLHPRGSSPAVLSFVLDPEHRGVWRLEAVGVRWPIWVRAFSPFVNPTFDVGSGEPVYTAKESYRRSVSLGGSVEGHVFVSASPGSTLFVSFTMAMRASPRITSRFDTRIRISD